MHIASLVPILITIAAVMPTVHSMDVDGRTTDLRLEMLLLPESSSYDAKADGSLGSLRVSGRDDLDRPFRFGVAGVSHQRSHDSAPIGMVIGGALYYSRLPLDANNRSERYEALSAQLRLGLGIYLGDIFHLEATPFAGIGGARASSNGEDSDIGLYWEYGVSTGAFVDFGDTIQLGLLAGWMHGEYDLDFSNGNFNGPVDNVNVELEQEGFFIGASIGMRL